MITARLAVAGSLWLASAGAGVVTARRGGRVSFPALLVAAGAVSAAVLTAELLARDQDQVTDSVLAALEIDRRVTEQEHRHRPLHVVRLAGRPLELSHLVEHPGRRLKFPGVHVPERVHFPL